MVQKARAVVGGQEDLMDLVEGNPTASSDRFP